jgi:multidrug efflux pump subunit AcrB
MGLVRMALRNPYSVIVMALAVTILGLTLLVRMPLDILPQFKTPAVQVLTTYTGMPTELMEEDITNRLERWTSQATGVDHQTSRSLLGVSVIRNFFHDDVDPSNALTQVSALATSDMHYLPPGTLPPIIQLFDPTASMPVALLAVSSDSLNETQLYDIGYYEIRTILSGAPGTIVPAAYGGNLRRIMVYLDKDKLQARSLSPLDVVDSLNQHNIMIPTGDANIGDYDYAVTSNAMVPTVDDLNSIPIKWADGKPIFVRDVGKAEDAYAIQTNVVRVDGRRCVYLPIYRQPGANTIGVVEGVKGMLGDLKHMVTNGSKLTLNVILDQSIYVREAIEGLEREGLMGFVLAAVAIFLFLGSWRATGIVAVALPLSLLPAFILLYFSGQTINVMTLGGLSLAVGMVMDNAIIVIENIARHIEEGETPWKAAWKGAAEIANAVMVATITMCIVFAPVSLMTGIGKFLFTPLALAVVFALASSYVMAMTLVPAACRYFMTAHASHGVEGHSVKKSWFERGYDRFQALYERMLGLCMRHRGISLLAMTGVIVASFALAPLIGTELFPEVDSGQFIVLMRAATGTRVTKTEEMVAKVENALRADIPKEDLRMVVSNIGVPQSLLAGYTPNAGPSDAFIMVQLNGEHKLSTQEYADKLRHDLPQAVPGVEFSFDTSGLISSALNFGLLFPIDIQITGPKVGTAKEIADVIRDRVAKIPGATDVHVQQRLDYPELDLHVDRTRAAAIGLTVEGVVKNLVTALNSSAQFTNNFWVDERNGNNYYIGATYRPEDINSRQTIGDVPINGTTQKQSVPLMNLSEIKTKKSAFEADHLNVHRVIDVYASVTGRDLGGVAGDIQKVLDDYTFPTAYHASILGEYAAMQQSFSSLGFGLVLAVILVYLAMVTQFRSFIDPFVVMFSVPPAFTGVLVILWMTHTTLNVQSLLGTIMVIGLTVSSSVLIVDFANNRMSEGANAFDAVVEASSIRLRPILMTAIAAIMGLVPTALHSGEANTPLARAVIGGLIVSTAVKMFLLPILYSYWKKSAPVQIEDPALEA